jgi:tRNA nucleotidyltransferase (CCA-adding enzyme)
VAETAPLAAATRLFDVPVGVVGGFVRDALLDRPHGPDIDLVVEGDAIKLARRVGRALGAMIVPYEQFGTATLELPHGGEVDFVTARRERYAHPGALPEVEPGTLSDDLARRDMTVNAIAYRLSGPRAGELVDPHGGRADLRDRLVRILRDDAFVEDPSRVVRAVRYAARLDFRIERRTAELAAEAAAGVVLQNARVADELARLLAEDSATAAAGLSLLCDLGVAWCEVPPEPAALAARFTALDTALAHPHAPRLPMWPLRLGLAVPVPLVRDAALPGWARGLAEEAAEGEDLAARLRDPTLSPSRVDAVLGSAKPASACAALAAGVDVVATWWERWRSLTLAIRGSDLVAAGVAPGPAVGRALRATRAAVLDGRAKTRDEQLRTALEAAR